MISLKTSGQSPSNNPYRRRGRLITILGPTATGKTKLAAKLAFHFNGEIISADSRQVYRGMDIGTGKDLNDYNVNGNIIKYHLIDIVDPQDEFNLFLFKKYFNESFMKIIEEGKLPFLAGGTGLYLSSILQNYKLHKVNFESERYPELNSKKLPELQSILSALSTKLHNTTDLLDKERVIRAIIVTEDKKAINVDEIEIDSLIIGVLPPRDIIKQRITERLKYRLQNGMIEEVKKLIENGISFEKLNFFGLEYRYICLYLAKELNYNNMYQKLNNAIHNFAKRQVTWFRKMEKEGVKINWIDSADFDKAEKIIRLLF
ncbi:MAG: tRNA (adenosine(37)-N6)-dimethylallyltransferase MiaA [Ignavibacteriaceae bacterium]